MAPDTQRMFTVGFFISLLIVYVVFGVVRFVLSQAFNENKPNFDLECFLRCFGTRFEVENCSQGIHTKSSPSLRHTSFLPLLLFSFSSDSGLLICSAILALTRSANFSTSSSMVSLAKQSGTCCQIWLFNSFLSTSITLEPASTWVFISSLLPLTLFVSVSFSSVFFFFKISNP